MEVHGVERQVRHKFHERHQSYLTAYPRRRHCKSSGHAQCQERKRRISASTFDISSRATPTPTGKILTSRSRGGRESVVKQRNHPLSAPVQRLVRPDRLPRGSLTAPWYFTFLSSRSIAVWSSGSILYIDCWFLRLFATNLIKIFDVSWVGSLSNIVISMIFPHFSLRRMGRVLVMPGLTSRSRGGRKGVDKDKRHTWSAPVQRLVRTKYQIYNYSMTLSGYSFLYPT